MPEQLSRAVRLEQTRTCWKRHIDTWRSSGITQTAYCQQHELKTHQFTYWKKRFARTDSCVTFVPVKIRGSFPPGSDTSSGSLRLIMDKDLAIEIRPDFDPGLLRRLIATIRSLP